MALDAAVIIVGGGPAGLMLANELGHRGIATVLLNDRPATSPHPQANATQARTMEFYRRLGFAETMRARGLPDDHPTDIAYFTRVTRHELARLEQPPAREARALIRRFPARGVPPSCRIAARRCTSKRCCTTKRSATAR